MDAPLALCRETDREVSSLSKRSRTSRGERSRGAIDDLLVEVFQAPGQYAEVEPLGDQLLASLAESSAMLGVPQQIDDALGELGDVAARHDQTRLAIGQRELDVLGI